MNRRDFLRASGLTMGLGLTGLPRLAASPPARACACIQLLLVGGPSQLDTFDPKPQAPTEVRGPFRPTRTRVPGLHFSELLPRLAERADRLAVVRSVCHDEAPIHETGLQLLQTGHLFAGGRSHPHVGGVLARLLPLSAAVPPWVVLPRTIGDTGVDISRGQGPQDYRVVLPRPGGKFADHCRLACHLVEEGVRFVTVNMFPTVFDQVTWDCHANGGRLPATLADYRDTVCPMFDGAVAALLDDLHDRGLLATTLVVAAGEFGRTPRVNANGGRDHWTGVWGVLLAGGGVHGGCVVGASDRLGAEPKDRPVHPAEVVATVYHAFGVDAAAELPGVAPIRELF